MQKLKKDLFSPDLPKTFIPQNDEQETTVYNHNVRTHTNEEGIEGYLYDTLICPYPFTSNSVFRQLLQSIYGTDQELKLQNEYFSVVEGVDEDASKQPYIDFLIERKTLKNQVDSDFQNQIL